MSIISNLLNAFEGYPFKLSEAYEACPTVNKESVRSRIYENLGTVFSKIGRGVYLARESDCIVIEGNGRDLSFLNDAALTASLLTTHGAIRNQTKVEIETSMSMMYSNIQLRTFLRNQEYSRRVASCVK